VRPFGRTSRVRSDSRLIGALTEGDYTTVDPR